MQRFRTTKLAVPIQNVAAREHTLSSFVSFVDLHHPSRRLARFRHSVTAFDHVSKLRRAQIFNKERANWRRHGECYSQYTYMRLTTLSRDPDLGGAP
ncbi:Uncharacterized protein DBV15_06922 [Temnothorax longispinosus]|uniref:Uncharacterized protein n=1 Tax=Temnothorax longispinosus TaxID=300112 RepID=A0A4S2KN06_9HYME|nr:Uncharacterized protein DBV15_06922 [Temnothorax longispinosus]